MIEDVELKDFVDAVVAAFCFCCRYFKGSASWFVQLLHLKSSLATMNMSLLGFSVIEAVQLRSCCCSFCYSYRCLK